MQAKEAIEVLKTFPENAEIQMFCSHEGKYEKASILGNFDGTPRFIPDNMLANIDWGKQPFVYCSS